MPEVKFAWAHLCCFNQGKESMIQRIQSVYLLIVTGLLIAAMCLPVGQFIAADGVTEYVFKPLGVTLVDRCFSVYVGTYSEYCF